MYEFRSQSRLISESFVQLPTTAKTGFSQLIKGAELMLHQNALQASRITELEEQLAVMTKRKARNVIHPQVAHTPKWPTPKTHQKTQKSFFNILTTA
jgi:hypothetical protein